MPAFDVFHEKDPKDALLEKVGPLDGVEIWNNHVLVAVYVRPNKTKGGIIITDKAMQEDVYQSKVGLVIAKGVAAFKSTADDGWFDGVECDVGDWVLFRPSDGYHMKWNNDVDVRLFKDTTIMGKVSDPDKLY